MNKDILRYLVPFLSFQSLFTGVLVCKLWNDVILSVISPLMKKHQLKYPPPPCVSLSEDLTKQFKQIDDNGVFISHLGTLLGTGALCFYNFLSTGGLSRVYQVDNLISICAKGI